MIRPAIEDDVPAIERLWQDLATYHGELDDALPVIAPDGPRRYGQRIAEQLHDSHTRVFVAEEDGEVVGYVLGLLVDLLPEMFEQERAGFVADIYVAPAYRERGIGRELVRAIKRWFQSLNVSHYEWYVASKNTAGIAFWRAVGGRDVMLRMRAPVEEES